MDDAYQLELPLFGDEGRQTYDNLSTGDNIKMKQRVPRGYWTQERCREEAEKYRGKTKGDFRRGSPKAHDAAIRHGWMKTYDFLVNGAGGKQTFWTKEACEKIALTCTCSTEMIQKSRAAYLKAYKERWLKDYVWWSPRKRANYTKEELRELIEAYLPKGKCVLMREKPGVYSAALRRHLLKEMNFACPVGIYGNVNSVYRYFFTSLNTVYVGRTINIERRDKEHRNDRKSSVYMFALEHDIPIPPIEIIATSLTAEESQVLEEKYVTLYKDRGMNVLNKGKVGKGIGSLGGKCSKYSKKRYIEIKTGCKSLYEFRTKYPDWYDAGIRHGWKDLSPLPKLWSPTELTLEKCIDIVVRLNLKTKTEIRSYAPSVFNYMTSRKLWKDFPNILISGKWPNSKPVRGFSKDGRLVYSFPSAFDAQRTIGISRGTVSACCKGKRKTAGGYIWRYADECPSKQMHYIQGDLFAS